MESGNAKTHKRNMMILVGVLLCGGIIVAAVVFMIMRNRRPTSPPSEGLVMNITAKDPMNAGNGLPKRGSQLPYLESTVGGWRFTPASNFLPTSDAINDHTPIISTNSAIMLNTTGLAETVGNDLTVFAVAQMIGAAPNMTAYAAYKPSNPTTRIAAYISNGYQDIDRGKALAAPFSRKLAQPPAGSAAPINVYTWGINSVRLVAYTGTDKPSPVIENTVVDVTNGTVQLFGDNSNLCQLIVYNQELSDADNDAVIAYIKSEWPDATWSVTKV